jgi:hypothetical protein
LPRFNIYLPQTAITVFFSLYVGISFLGIPQDCIFGWLLLLFALFFFVCFSVVWGFFSTCATWLHVEGASAWMWANVDSAENHKPAAADGS